MALPYFPALIFTAAGMAIPFRQLTFAPNQLQDNTGAEETPGTQSKSQVPESGVTREGAGAQTFFSLSGPAPSF
jgi:hypothetical protein